MAQVNAGRVRFVSRGEYNNTTQYFPLDLVNYNGNSYFAKNSTQGNLPTNTTYWQLIAEKGNIGPTGPTGNGIASIVKTSTSGLVDTYTTTFTDGTTTTFDITNGEDGEVTQEQLDKVQAELDFYKMLENALPKVTGEGESITLDNTAKSPMKLGFKGQIQQDGTPTPTTPQDIHLVSGDNTINITGKNLYEDEYIGVPTSTYQNAHLKAGTYTLATSDSNSFGTNVYFYLFKNNERILESGHLTTSNTTINYSTNTNVYYGGEKVSYIIFTIDDDYDLNIGLLNSTNTRQVMLVKGTTINRTYEPYTGASYPINLGDLEVGGIGEYEDEFFKNTTDSEYYDSTLELDKWYLKKRIGKVIFDGSSDEIWILNSSGTYTKYQWSAALPDKYNVVNTPLYCSHFKQITVAQGNALDVIGIANGSYSGYSIQIISDITTRADFKNWLSTNQPIVYYILATPTNILLNDTLQETLDIFYSMQEQTNISQTNNDLPFVIKASAIRDMSGIYDI